MLGSLISNGILPSSAILHNVLEIPLVALDIHGKERSTGLTLSFLKTVAVSSRNQMT